MKSRILFVTIAMLISVSGHADTLSMREWLCASRAIDWPAFSDRGDVAVLLDADQLNFSALRPREGEFAPGATPPQNMWAKISNWEAWPHPCYRESPRIGYGAVYVSSNYNQAVKLRAHSRNAFAVYVDGKEIGRATAQSDDGYRLDQTLPMEHGKSLLIVKAILLPDSVLIEYLAAPRDQIELNFDLKPEQAGAISVTTNADYTFERFEDMTLFDDVSAPAISPDGGYVAYIRSNYKPDHTKESRLEVMEIARRNVIYSTPPIKGLGNIFFLPSPENMLIYSTSGDKGSTIWKMWIPQCIPQVVIRDVDGLVKIALGGGNVSRLYYSTDKEADENKNDYALFDELEDRLSDWTRTRELFAVPLDGGVVTRIIAAYDSFALDEFAPSAENGRVLFTRRVPKLVRPYFDTQFWLLDTDKNALRQIVSLPIAFETRPLSFTWLPGAREIAFVAAAHFTNPADTVYPSYSQTALYVLNVETGSLRNLTEGSRFSIEESEDRGAVRYNKSDGRLWFRAVMDSRIQFMSVPYDQPGAKAEHHYFYVPVTTDFDIADNGRRIFIASGPSNPNTLYMIEGTKLPTLLEPSRHLYDKVQLAGYSSQPFVNSAGDTIDGALYFPENFAAASHTWPVVVYFYGGASPRDLRFTYTYHWWVANGYVVYVLNPRGCIGYGEKFAAQHANDWGTLASQDIIEGTQKLLAETPYLDKNRVGAYGGSYGGFITMDLATKTDLFTALCSMSGISTIGSYFGAGQWGFTYGDLALPGSYPWNRRDVFVEKSPYFNADKVRSPLLLMHGSDDSNVPVGESDQMFTALKLLGKNVSYVRFKGEDHIFSKFANRMAEREILREWFDLHLKSDPTDWNARWKK